MEWTENAFAYLRELLETELIPPCDVHAVGENAAPACGQCGLYYDLVELVSAYPGDAR